MPKSFLGVLNTLLLFVLIFSILVTWVIHKNIVDQYKDYDSQYRRVFLERNMYAEMYYRLIGEEELADDFKNQEVNP